MSLISNKKIMFRERTVVVVIIIIIIVFWRVFFNLFYKNIVKKNFLLTKLPTIGH